MAIVVLVVSCLSCLLFCLFLVSVVFVDQVVSLDLYTYYHQRPVRKILFGTGLIKIWTG